MKKKEKKGKKKAKKQTERMKIVLFCIKNTESAKSFQL